MILVSILCYKCGKRTPRTVLHGLPTPCPLCAKREISPTLPGIETEKEQAVNA